MNRDIIELQIGASATAVLVLDNEVSYLDDSVILTPTSADVGLFKSKSIRSMIESKLFSKRKQKVSYLVIRNISSLSNALQSEIEGIIKDREILDFKLPNNCVIILTIENKSEINKISQGLYRFLIEA